MRALFVTNMFPPHHFGGYELLCLDAANRFATLGHDVTVVTSDVISPTATPMELAFPVHRDLRLYWQDHEILRPGPIGAARIERHNQRVLRREIDSFAPDVVSCWNLGALSLGLLTRVRREGLPEVHVVCDDWLVYGPLIDRWTSIGRHLGRPIRAVAAAMGLPFGPDDLARGATFSFISETTRRTAEVEAGLSFDHAVLGYCGINLDDFPISGPRQRPWEWRLLYVGRIDDRKGIDIGIRALAQLPETATLHVVGTGDDRHLADLVSLADDLGLGKRVAFSHAPRDELAAIYASADALLFTPRWAEPFGMVPVESMACGTPVISTGTGGSGEFLLDGFNCLRVPVDDPDATSAAVRRLAADADLRSTLVAGGVRTALELDEARFLEFLDRLHVAAAERAITVPGRARLAETLGFSAR